MFAGIQGTVVDIRQNRISVNVGGVWYLLSVTHPEKYHLDDTVLFHTYLAVRENALDLYGFDTRDELLMFEELIKIPKIGPKTALQILSQADVVTLKNAVREADPAYLSKVSGIGKKSAEKIVLGLRDVCGDMILEGDGVGIGSSDADVIEALIALGYSQRDALSAVQKIPAEIVEMNARITFALRAVGK